MNNFVENWVKLHKYHNNIVYTFHKRINIMYSESKSMVNLWHYPKIYIRKHQQEVAHCIIKKGWIEQTSFTPFH